MNLLKLPSTDKPVVSIFSGGLDSTVMTYALVKKYGAKNVKVLMFDYNQKHKIELKKAMKTIKKLGLEYKKLNISFLSDINKNFSSLSGKSKMSSSSNNYIANRNSILINIAASYAETVGACYVFYGAQSRDTAGFWDCSKDFVESLNNVFRLNKDHKIRVIAPFMGIEKSDEIKLGYVLKVPFEDTWTCYNPNHNKPCGKCPACLERARAFAQVGLVDKLLEKKR